MTDLAPQKELQAALDAPPIDTRVGMQKFFPKWVVDNATQITNFGLMTFTSVMLHSGYKGKKISQEIYDKQVDLLKGAGYSGERLASKITELKASKVIKEPGWHKLRLVYLLTAVTSFAFGTFFKRKEETPEELANYKQMSLPEYMSTRFGQAFDPVNHSRQTVGVVSSLSGIFAIISALSQPGGVHQSELLVGTSLATGGAGLAMINNPKDAQNWFSGWWMARLPFIGSGTYESVYLKPGYKHPLASEMKNSAEYSAGLQKAATEGFKTQPWYTFHLPFLKRTLKAEDAKKAYDKAFGNLSLPERRKDYAYPIGQWGNLFSAGIGFLDKSKQKQPKTVEAPVHSLEPVAPVATTVAPVEVMPSTKVSKAAEHALMQADQPMAEVSAARA